MPKDCHPRPEDNHLLPDDGCSPPEHDHLLAGDDHFLPEQGHHFQKDSHPMAKDDYLLPEAGHLMIIPNRNIVIFWRRRLRGLS